MQNFEHSLDEKFAGVKSVHRWDSMSDTRKRWLSRILARRASKLRNDKKYSEYVALVSRWDNGQDRDIELAGFPFPRPSATQDFQRDILAVMKDMRELRVRRQAQRDVGQRFESSTASSTLGQSQSKRFQDSQGKAGESVPPPASTAANDPAVAFILLAVYLTAVAHSIDSLQP